jgi:hypothetical protein
LIRLAGNDSGFNANNYRHIQVADATLQFYIEALRHCSAHIVDAKGLNSATVASVELRDHCFQQNGDGFPRRYLLNHRTVVTVQ